MVRTLRSTNNLKKVASSSNSNVLDFRAPLDDGWYSVRLTMDDDKKLRVIYTDFSEEYDELYATDSFKDEQELEEFESRFRPVSLQLQDSECNKVIEGMYVCASLEPSNRELRFHDASIDLVEFAEHETVDGEDICKCTFTVLWLHGPMAGQKSSIGVERICLHQPFSPPIDPILEHFLYKSRRRLAQQLRQREQGTANRLIIPEELENYRMEENLNRQPESNLLPKEVMQDQDLGGRPSQNNIAQEDICPIIEIKNLEKNITIQEIANIIRRHIFISFEIILSPGLHENSAFIYPENVEIAETIYEFLRGPGYVIMSSRGRSWFVTENRQTESETLPCSGTRENSNNVKFLLPGTAGYERGRVVRAEYARSISSNHNAL